MWQRLSRVVRSFVGFFISVAEDPELILQQNIRDMNDQVPRMNESIAMVKANVTLLEKEEAKYKNDVAGLTAKVKVAIQANRDDLAGSFAAQLEQTKGALARNQGQLANARAAFEKAMTVKQAFMQEKERKTQEALGAIADYRRAQWQKKVADAMDLAERCSTEIRTLSYLLHPPMLDELGLNSALSIYIQGFAKRSGIDVHLEISEDVGRLPTEIEMVLFRVVQQSLANIHKHSGSPRANITIKIAGQVVLLKICDHGHGIPAAILNDISTNGLHAGVGLTGMRERVVDMGGSFAIESSANGTTIDVKLPFLPLSDPD